MAVVSLVPLSFLCFLLIDVSQTTAQPQFFNCTTERGNFTITATYKANLNTVLANLTANTQIDNGFYNLSDGQDPDKVTVIGLCRGDLKPDDCRSCLNDAREFLPQNCPNNKEAIVYYEKCMLRYSNRSILGVMEDTPRYNRWEGNNVTGAEKYNETLFKLLTELQSRAASGDSHLKFATGDDSGPNFQNIYALVECTPDLSSQLCSSCLDNAFSYIPNCCDRRRVVIIGSPSCNIRYGNYLFYESNINNPLQEKSNRLRTIIAIVVPVLAFITLVTFVCIYLMKGRLRKHSGTKDDIKIKSADELQFTYDTIKVATNNFSDENKLGEGGFGPVYKGRLSNRQEIAVKRMSMTSSQGDEEFKREVMFLAELQHRNLVKLLGFCLEKTERLLIYEFVPNKSLNYFLMDSSKKAELDWEKRYKIIEGTARGLLYIHEDSRRRIIHRDIKASNILLDVDMNPKISDFGFARDVVIDRSHENTRTIVGTYGYIAPEFENHGQFSIKSDVFSFGVLILEIISGCKINRHNVANLLANAWKNLMEGTALNIADPTLTTGATNEIKRCIHIGLLCVQESVNDRPTMNYIVRMLDSPSTNLAMPSKPGYFESAGNLPENRSGLEGTEQIVQASENEASIAEQP